MKNKILPTCLQKNLESLWEFSNTSLGVFRAEGNKQYPSHDYRWPLITAAVQSTQASKATTEMFYSKIPIITDRFYCRVWSSLFSTLLRFL